MGLIDQVHQRAVHPRRVRRLSGWLAPLLPEAARVVDIGCGDGLVTSLIAQARPDLAIEGVDVLVREQTHVPVRRFDGRRLPYGDRAVDAVLFVDTLHHTDDPRILLREARRVARRAIVIKDHTLDGWLAGPTLRFMDRVGNARHGVALPYVYWPKQRWLAAFTELGLRMDRWIPRLSLYPWPASALFDRSLQFIARLDVQS